MRHSSLKHILIHICSQILWFMMAVFYNVTENEIIPRGNREWKHSSNDHFHVSMTKIIWHLIFYNLFHYDWMNERPNEWNEYGNEVTRREVSWVETATSSKNGNIILRLNIYSSPSVILSVLFGISVCCVYFNHNVMVWMRNANTRYESVGKRSMKNSILITRQIIFKFSKWKNSTK